MKSAEIRQKFLDFFEKKSHMIVPSAPMVIKGDPTLMFTNAGMNQFKDIILGNVRPKATRVADSQKCLRVSGKHNDLEEVGHDTYHHTMFEMLGNWSFGDYFKKEAIAYAWEFLTEEMKLDKERLYATVFEGSKEDHLDADTEALTFWSDYLPRERILFGNKKDNFWEMGDMGPCGPCSEIHIDLRPEEERKLKPGCELVNKDHPLVIEIWNLVFMQYNRKADGSLENLPNHHVDTGMGFERLCMAVQGKRSNYDTDVFTPILEEISELSGIRYGKDEKADIAMRVVADHLRTIAFSITDGQLPSNVKAGYVIRRILRRAVRYAYTFLGQKEAFMFRLVPVLIEVMGQHYPELSNQRVLIERVIQEEEQAFFKTLDKGIKLLDRIIAKTKEEDYVTVPGNVAFELYDTYGFPLDLTELILRENGLVVNRREFKAEMEAQKERSRSAAAVDTDDWVELIADDTQEFVGYDYTETEVRIARYRRIITKGKTFYQLVFNITPFYGEGGGQVGDSGYLVSDVEKIRIIDTQKENGLTVHITDKLPGDLTQTFTARVDTERRTAIANNHTATHLLHHALREVLGTHVEQKGSFVSNDYLRFDFSHFQKVTNEELDKVAAIVNRRIRENSLLEENRSIPIGEAKKMGAMAIFGEKYGDLVRVVKFGESVELCGGTHAHATGQLGFFKIVSESSVAAGIRRIEAITAAKAEEYILNHFHMFNEVENMFKSNRGVLENIRSLLEENVELKKDIEKFENESLKIAKNGLKNSKRVVRDINFISKNLSFPSTKVKDLAFQLKGEVDRLVLIIGGVYNGKPHLTVMISESLVKEYDLHAGQIVKDAAQEMKGGGGGQPFFATAGGSDPDGVEHAIQRAERLILDKIKVDLV
ncbi:MULTISPECIES: alanine--tRNA ligase [Sanguibacteroides]|uniref:Alanine--tRNA ligase n=1 Tax=Sanguibacteroides justesenii TaxID=1547597 RepID=A0A0C3R237_9PORP|nr:MULTISPECIES: alanine--tRNA ligase [Sanguibacteroides]KIO42895.1 alanyl-tRNA synthetase [Sanguibacteroides justesenii]KIO46148.1 alanyl-tRNA synthetase [Sanguibacteroides justesenii]PXZ44214.1 alanine--tRNA ligase [Sanguibacteroides justesenii]